jgi:ribosomal protein L21E
VRRGEGSLTKKAADEGISRGTVRRATGAFRKRDRRWIPTKTDRVQRWLKSYEDGRRVEVLVGNSRVAGVLSRYAHAVAVYLETGDSQPLAKFGEKRYRDASGKVHSFETKPEAIRSAVERSESDFGAFADLYAEPEGDEEIG